MRFSNEAILDDYKLGVITLEQAKEGSMKLFRCEKCDACYELAAQLFVHKWREGHND